MSSSFDSIQRIFMDRFEPTSGDDFEKQLFLSVIMSLHSANHAVGDEISKNRDVTNSVRILEEYLTEKETLT
jgi:hypothetical protein